MSHFFVLAKQFFFDPGLIASFALVGAIILISYFLKLKIGKETLWAAARGFLQLSIAGFSLIWILDHQNTWMIAAILLGMVTIAGKISQSRGKSIPNIFWITTSSLFISFVLIFGFLLLTGSIQPQAEYLILIGGMVIGYSMNGASLALNRLKAEVQMRREEILVYLSLGSTPYQAMHGIIQSCLKSSLIPAIDGLKVLGVIFLPGLMAGMILEGASPLEAVRLQIITVFMTMAGYAFTNLSVLFLSYRQFFTPQMQLREIK